MSTIAHQQICKQTLRESNVPWVLKAPGGMEHAGGCWEAAEEASFKDICQAWFPKYLQYSCHKGFGKFTCAGCRCPGV